MALKPINEPFLKLRKICIDYSSIRALKDINLDILSGEIHAIVGEPGSGKSSLAMIISGMTPPSKGEVLISGVTPFQFSLKEAQRCGIKMVYQENLLIDHFSVAENILYKSNFGSRLGFYSKKKNIAHAQDFLRSFGFSIDVNIKISNLSLSEKTVVEILKNLYTNPTLLILDEALEKLSATHYGKVLPILQERKNQGMGILSITHKIEDVFNFADRISVLKDGALLITDRVDNINKLNLIRMAYTQFGTANKYVSLDTEFYQILKYNEAILQHLPVNIIVLDNQLIVKMINDYCVNSFGLTDHIYLNISITELLQESEKALTLIKESVTTHKAATFYHIDIKVNQLNKLVNIKTYPVFDGYMVLGTIILLEDITEYDKMQNQLILSEKLASVGLLAAGVAHEINNPLEIISNYLSYLKYTQTNSEVIEVVDKVNKEISYISKIVNNLITFAVNKTPNYKRVDINLLITEILKLLEYNSEYKHIKIDFVQETKRLVFLGDSDHIKQVILNLIKNSFEAMPEGGVIHIVTREGVLNSKKSIQLIFEDNGPGFKAKDLNTIFLPFYSTKTGKKKHFGIGLGLSICYRLIESYKGEISVENLQTGGCRFIINLPSAM